MSNISALRQMFEFDDDDNEIILRGEIAALLVYYGRDATTSLIDEVIAYLAHPLNAHLRSRLRKGRHAPYNVDIGNETLNMIIIQLIQHIVNINNVLSYNIPDHVFNLANRIISTIYSTILTTNIQLRFVSPTEFIYNNKIGTCDELTVYHREAIRHRFI
jgi:hypothetical protein